MKKLIILFLFPLFALGQEFNEAVQVTTSDTITTDTYYWVKLDQNVAWRLTVTYSGNTSSSTTIAPVSKSTQTGAASLFSGITAQAATSSATTVSFANTYSLDEYLGIFVDLPVGESIILNIWYYLSKK